MSLAPIPGLVNFSLSWDHVVTAPFKAVLRMSQALPKNVGLGLFDFAVTAASSHGDAHVYTVAALQQRLAIKSGITSKQKNLIGVALTPRSGRALLSMPADSATRLRIGDHVDLRGGGTDCVVAIKHSASVENVPWREIHPQNPGASAYSVALSLRGWRSVSDIRPSRKVSLSAAVDEIIHLRIEHRRLRAMHAAAMGKVCGFGVDAKPFIESYQFYHLHDEP